ncbi:hypothetical protein MA16_Dca010955 [Dendrobium catenatum]|uniref:Uncharacterized protein n=2 Tax=Dendrobium catenatum TaxID=906689 RepID=A0A2I0WVP5_9ASPA|nr:hypothetical protein MA16_Dca010955 [Dendrobium catenatum]
MTTCTVIRSKRLIVHSRPQRLVTDTWRFALVRLLRDSPLNSPLYPPAQKISLRDTRDRNRGWGEAETKRSRRKRSHHQHAMEWWNRMIFPAKRVWVGVAARFSLRKNGLRKLRQEVSTCEYEDVRVMWEMLRRNEIEIARSPPLNDQPATKLRRRWVMFDWPPYNLCASF